MVKETLVLKVKILLKNKGFLFLLLLFPIILATFFKFSFSDTAKGDSMKPISIAVVDTREENKGNQSTICKKIYKQALSEGKFQCNYLESGNATNLLEKGEVCAVVTLNEDGADLTIRENGLEQTLVKQCLDEAKQKINILKQQKKLTDTKKIEKLWSNKSFEKEDILTSKSNLFAIYLYTILGMTAMYGSLIGVREVFEIKKEQSDIAKRISMSSISIKKIFLIRIVCDGILESFCMILIIIYMHFALAVDFGKQYFMIAFTTWIASFCGILLGTFAGIVLKTSQNMKAYIVIAISTILAFFSGLTGEQIKYQIMTKAPVINHLNPVSDIADSFYALYYYQGHKEYWINILCLAIWSLLALTGTLFLIRRKKDDRI